MKTPKTEIKVIAPEFLRIKDILEILKKANVKISRTTFDRWRKEGSFPKPDYQFGGSCRWTMDTFKKWLAACVAQV